MTKYGSPITTSLNFRPFKEITTAHPGSPYSGNRPETGFHKTSGCSIKVFIHKWSNLYSHVPFLLNVMTFKPSLCTFGTFSHLCRHIQPLITVTKTRQVSTPVRRISGPIFRMQLGTDPDPQCHSWVVSRRTCHG